MARLDVDPSKIPLSLASCSIGLPKHSLHQKLEAISQAGFQGIELSFPDLLSHANELVRLGQIKTKSPSNSKDGSSDQDQVAEDDWPSLCEAAKSAAHLCSTHNLQILVLQPFANFEGWPRDSPERKAVFARARGWLSIMEASGCSMLQVGSTDSPGASGDRKQLASDLAELADLLGTKGFRIAYENWCWATHAPDWKDVWEIVKLADRENIGLCLDTFQSAGGEWGDPTTKSGKLEGKDGGVDEAALQKSWEDSMRELADTVPADKIYFLQISDAYHVQPPLVPRPEPNDDTGLRPRGRWSHDYRPLPYDGGYLPIADFTRAVLGTGFRGWLSVEVFDGQFEKKYGEDLMAYAEKAKASTVKLIQAGRHGGDEDLGDGQDDEKEEVDKGEGKPFSMQAKRMQRIRGNYEGETRALPSGQDWPESHSMVKRRVSMVEERDSLMESKGGRADGGGDV
ncbi:3-dehydroshikimate dehydratase [Diaporthe amygdali]|uniref:3-dehydroshikimate dehydratase n=1 Tax=Phomopsis amygdali TaxID=1214568 RepID=UPI0022FE3874|nr:3-dehydroshikimate dehydratase [Diaporthe amygdali]KAJ0122023.1 3-dehydroshikimate dehydratase [Diaporthe amygdali]